jgi:RsiW-degrading membrane proteinase PrsW (M82 family)
MRPPARRCTIVPMRWTARSRPLHAALALGALALAIILVELGPRAFAVGVLFAVLPVPVYLGLALWLDRFEPEPPQVLATTFLWGATVAAALALVVNSAVDALARDAAGDLGGLLTSVLWAPVVEEAAKGVALLLLMRQARDDFDGVTDGVVYAAMVGLGFAMLENVQYYGRAAAGGVDASVAVFLLRGVVSPFAHPLFTAMTGIGVGLARERPGGPTALLAPLAGFVGAVLLHAGWNLAASLDAAFAPTYVVVMMPVFVATLALVRRSLGREALVIREQLAPLVADGLLTAAELDALCTLRGRTAASLRAARRAGVPGWRRRIAFHRAVADLAFTRWRAGRDGVVVEITEVQLVRLCALREPPPPGAAGAPLST